MLLALVCGGGNKLRETPKRIYLRFDFLRSSDVLCSIRNRKKDLSGHLRRPAASRDYHAHEDTMSCFYRLAEDGRISMWLRCFPDTTNRLNNNSRANKNPSKIGKPNLGIIVARIRDATTL